MPNDIQDLLDFDLEVEKTPKGEIIPNERITSLITQINELEDQIKIMEEMKIQRDNLKIQLKLAMEDNELRKVELPNGTKITLVADTPDTEVEEEYVDHDELVQKYAELHIQYMKAEKDCTHTRTTTKKGRKGYIRITTK